MIGCLKIALALAFLSAVADRFGLWGAPGSEGVFWGNFENFVAYTRLINPWFPKVLAAPISYFITGLEIALAILLFTKWKTKEVAFISGLLLLTFAVAMTFSLGPKSAFDYNVFTAAFAAFALYCLLRRRH
ncbi:hypothetical protein AXK12_03720 [Cephaloticoccus capnophilus]|uniref:DoxX family protein n=1 Tax=Cephaloticoccus capnophilus TaxID=1548208 RepID=A0A139SP03_9BACT|nr:hypothetical protein [Cephaloticoccus capnophilus]KXU36252.1 hypothetical protein AXK12_03720 [Cephaloticoccus capnophilus]